MQKRLLVIIAHPDDESFGVGGTLAKYAKAGAEIHVLCATKGEGGKGKGNLGQVREQELLKASQIIGVTNVEFLNYQDGTLSNNLYHEVAAKIETKIKKFQPQIVLTFDLQGVSGHLDHIFMSLVTTYVCRKFNHRLKLFYLCELKKYTRLVLGYFIYFPPGKELKDIDVVIDITDVWDIKVKAMKAHLSQMQDVKRILLLKRFVPKKEYFTCAFPKNATKHVSDFFEY